MKHHKVSGHMIKKRPAPGGSADELKVLGLEEQRDEAAQPAIAIVRGNGHVRAEELLAQSGVARPVRFEVPYFVAAPSSSVPPTWWSRHQQAGRGQPGQIHSRLTSLPGRPPRGIDQFLLTTALPPGYRQPLAARADPPDFRQAVRPRRASGSVGTLISRCRKLASTRTERSAGAGRCRPGRPLPPPRRPTPTPGSSCRTPWQ